MNKQNLQSVDRLSKEEVEVLMEQLDVSKMDIADACGFTYSTLQTYWYDRIPEIHQETIIQLFLDKFEGNGNPGKNGTEPAADKAETEDSSTEESEPADPAPPATNDEVTQTNGLRYLVPDRIIFRPKGSVGEALQEAAEIADEERSEVVVRVGSRLICVKVEEVDT